MKMTIGSDYEANKWTIPYRGSPDDLDRMTRTVIREAQESLSAECDSWSEHWVHWHVDDAAGEELASGQAYVPAREAAPDDSDTDGDL